MFRKIIAELVYQFKYNNYGLKNLFFLSIGLMLSITVFVLLVFSKKPIEQYYERNYLVTEIRYGDILVDTKMDLVDLDLNDSIKLLRYNEGLLLLEKYRSFDSIAEAMKRSDKKDMSGGDNYKLLLPAVNADTIKLQY